MKYLATFAGFCISARATATVYHDGHKFAAGFSLACLIAGSACFIVHFCRSTPTK